MKSCNTSCNTCDQEGLCITCKPGYYINEEQTCEICPLKCPICDQNDKNKCLLCY